MKEFALLLSKISLTARGVPEGLPRELGMTDRAGRIVLPPGFANSLVILRLLAGTVEPMVELPMMPGESTEGRVIPFDPKPLTVSCQVQLDAFRDEVIDLVALRARLEKRMAARLQGEDFAGLEAALKEYAQLPLRESFGERLSKLKDEAAKQPAESKTAVLTKTIQAQFNEVQALIDRYLDDEPFRAYTEALERKRAELAEKAKTKDKARRRAPSSPIPPSAVSESQAASTAEQSPAPQHPAAPKPRPATPKPGDVPF